MKQETKPRPIRMTDEEWDAFRENLGNTWLRKKIAESIKRKNRKPTAHKPEA